MRFALILCSVLVCGHLIAQEPAPTLKLSIGTPKSAVAEAFGKRFGPFKVTPDDDNAKIGVPTGLWDVYHLTAPPDRMYVTIVHFGTPSTGSASAELVDGLMLMPAGSATVRQILKDQPAFASVCKAVCESVLVRNKAGNRSLLFRPKDPHTNTVLYFEGDSAVLKWASVTSMDSIVSWAYALSRSQFEAHRKPIDDEVIGVWSSEIASSR